MTVGELIAHLTQFDPNLPAMTPGFDESGLDHLGTVRPAEAVPVPWAHAHSGDFEEIDDDRPVREGEKPFQVVVVEG